MFKTNIGTNTFLHWNEYIFRFANTLQLNSVSVDNIQNVVKTVRAGTSLDLNCGGNYILADDGPLDQVKAVEQMLQIESSEQIHDTLTREELRTAGEMFLYLNMCPDKIKPWIGFYNRSISNPVSRSDNTHFKQIDERVEDSN